MSYTENAQKLKAEIDKNQATVDMVEAAGGIRKSAPEQSDKVGFDYVHYYVNNVLVASEYVPQEIPMGTAEYPIAWQPGMHLIQNAYYVHEGVKKVWMGDKGAVAQWDDPWFVEM